MDDGLVIVTIAPKNNQNFLVTVLTCKPKLAEHFIKNCWHTRNPRCFLYPKPLNIMKINEYNHNKYGITKHHRKSFRLLPEQYRLDL